jgi:hypothetical protein
VRTIVSKRNQKKNEIPFRVGDYMQMLQPQTDKERNPGVSWLSFFSVPGNPAGVAGPQANGS